MAVIKLKNMTDAPKAVWQEAEGKDPVEYRLEPHGAEAFDREIAELFLAQYPGLVMEHVQTSVPDQPITKGTGVYPRLWVVNGTGNPFLPETLIIPPKKDSDLPITIPNPNRDPKTLKWDLAPTEIPIDNGDGTKSAVRIPGSPVVLAAMERISMPAPLVTVLMDRDGLSPYPGKLQHCREPQPWEASPSWDLDDLVIYAHLVDPRFFTRERIAAHKWASSRCEDQTEERSAKKELWSYLFFRIVDRNYGLPSKQVFENRKAGIVKALEIKLKEPAPVVAEAPSSIGDKGAASPFAQGVLGKKPSGDRAPAR